MIKDMHLSEPKGKKMKIVLLQGGMSPEREISISSSTAIASAISRLKHELCIIDPANFPKGDQLILAIKNEKTDMVFIGLHGGDGENGSMQKNLKLADIPFTGSDHAASAIAMDKYITSTIASSLDIPIPQQILLSQTDEVPLIDFSYPVVVKPNAAGSSVGTHIVEHPEDIHTAIADAFLYDNKILVQRFIIGRELSVSILGDMVLPVIEIKPLAGFYDFTNKYSKGKTKYICPAPLSVDETMLVQSFAQRVFQKVGCSVYGRVDFIYDGDKFYFLEINTLPGMTQLSLVPMAAKEVGIDFDALIQRILMESSHTISKG
jgi:D-alanine-D-alanine ligase